MPNSIPLSTEFGIRAALKLPRASRRHFKSSQVEQARKLLELVLAECPPRPRKDAGEKNKINEHADLHIPSQIMGARKTLDHD